MNRNLIASELLKAAKEMTADSSAEKNYAVKSRFLRKLLKDLGRKLDERDREIPDWGTVSDLVHVTDKLTEAYQFLR